MTEKHIPTVLKILSKKDYTYLKAYCETYPEVFLEKDDDGKSILDLARASGDVHGALQIIDSANYFSRVHLMDIE